MNFRRFLRTFLRSHNLQIWLIFMIIEELKIKAKDQRLTLVTKRNWRIFSDSMGHKLENFYTKKVLKKKKSSSQISKVWRWAVCVYLYQASFLIQSSNGWYDPCHVFPFIFHLLTEQVLITPLQTFKNLLSSSFLPTLKNLPKSCQIKIHETLLLANFRWD